MRCGVTRAFPIFFLIVLAFSWATPSSQADRRGVGEGARHRTRHAGASMTRSLELRIIGARVYERPDFEEAVKLVVGGTIPADELITDVMPLAETAAAIERLASGESVVKLLIDCQS